MKTTTISDLKAHLSNYLSKVKSGTEVLVTDRGKPVARIIPISGKKRTRQSLSGMERQGLMKLGTGKVPQDFWTTLQGEDSKDSVLKALLEERKEGR